MKVAILRSLARAVAAALVCTAAGVDCTPADVTDPFAQVCDDYAFAYCKQVAACSSTAIEIRFGTAAICAALFKESCLAISKAPHTALTPATQAACTQAIPTWDCADFLLTQNPPPGCQPLVGPLPEGAPCSDPVGVPEHLLRLPVRSELRGVRPTADRRRTSCADTGCAVGLLVRRAPRSCAEPYAGVGASCSATGIKCATGLVCGNGTCQPAPGKSSESCVLTAGVRHQRRALLQRLDQHLPDHPDLAPRWPVRGRRRPGRGLRGRDLHPRPLRGLPAAGRPLRAHRRELPLPRGLHHRRRRHHGHLPVPAASPSACE